MAKDFDIDMSDALKLAERAETAPKRLGAKAASTVRKTAAQVEADERRLAPVGETGQLRENISTEFQGDGRSGEMTATVGTTVPYGPFQEFGTAFQQPQPFIAPALEANRQAFLKGLTADARESF